MCSNFNVIDYVTVFESISYLLRVERVSHSSEIVVPVIYFTYYKITPNMIP